MKRWILILFSMIFISGCFTGISGDNIKLCENFCGGTDNIKEMIATFRSETDICVCINGLDFQMNEIIKMNKHLEGNKAEKE